MQAASQGKINDVEILRGYAIFLVLICHLRSALIVWSDPILNRLYSYIGSGSGVDLFFVISGFVIARSLYPALKSSTNFRAYAYVSLAFWTRRAWRIVPSAWIWLGIILLAATRLNDSGVFQSAKAATIGAIYALFQIHNYWLAKCFGHFDCGANFYYWTLSLEEQFYLILPFAILVSRKWFPYLVACLALAQLGVANRSAILTTFRTDGLMLGVMLALWSTKPSYRRIGEYIQAVPQWLRMTTILILCAVMMFDAKLFNGNQVAFSFSTIALVSAALVWIGSYDKGWLIPPALLQKPLMWLGSRSWSLYLIHIPAFLFAKEMWYRIMPKGAVLDISYALPLFLAGSSLVYILGEGNYRLLELPSREKGRKISRRFLEQRGIRK